MQRHLSTRARAALAVVTLTLSVGVSVGASAAAPAADFAPPASRDPVIPFERYQLANGLDVILVPDSSAPLVAVDVWYHVGAGNEVPGRSGFAHLFEHMLFQGSQHVGSDRHFELLRKAGASGINGTTNFDRTNYYEVVPSNQLETALWLESDRMGYMLPLLDAASLKNQIDVVRNERRQRYDNVPYGNARFALGEAMYPEGHPYRYLVIGRHEDLEAASVEDVAAFFRTWYVPANATLVVAGDFEPAEARRLVDRWFGSFPKSVRPAAPQVPAPAGKRQRLEVTDGLARLRQITWAWHTPAFYAPGDAELDVVAESLARPGTGRLYKLLVHEKQLAQSVEAAQYSHQLSSQFLVTVTLRSGVDLAEVERLVMAEVESVRRQPPAARELAQVVANRESAAIFGLQQLLTRAETLQQYNHYLGDPGRLSWDLDRYRKATAEGVRAAAEKYLRPEIAVEVISLPAPGAKPDAQPAARPAKPEAKP